MDLRDGQSLWLDSSDDCATAILTDNHDVDIAVIGAGVSGAIVADALINAGITPTLFDRAKPAMGSTAASTAIATHELDTHLCDLINLYGQWQAEHLYRSCFEAMNRLACRLMHGQEGGKTIRYSPSLYIAHSEQDACALKKEYAARKSAGIPVDLVSARQLRDRYHVQGQAALLSEKIFCINPVKVTKALLRNSIARGLRVFEKADLLALEQHSNKVELCFRNGARVRANYVVMANGYEMTKILSNDGVKLVSSYVLASEPVLGPPPWKDQDLVMWETARPYLYIRSSEDGRYIVGGGDCPVKSSLLRKLAAAVAFRRLQSAFKRYWPHQQPKFTHRWLGIFAESDDGLPIIGPDPKRDRVFYILNSGGNGLIFAELAAKLLVAWLSDREAELPNALRVRQSKSPLKLAA